MYTRQVRRRRPVSYKLFSQRAFITLPPPRTTAAIILAINIIVYLCVPIPFRMTTTTRLAPNPQSPPHTPIPPSSTRRARVEFNIIH